ncbi:MAG: ImmA/IrrE family metallo-endopeptidase [Candidatus Thiodiazotropha sp.]|nr:ImmA/IrrE family metallo-endopeptidase [Candidatus Thiodiazotropha taylori]MBV2093295.1 ImmA/IrrE family metallo-endopeptidase [Candidatus Thiodiazotropha sp. (ex Codakia orbicularis)]PUB72867.1 MAG: hypothetical protein DBP03_15215 [gamma proteobacterium symbiont of Ctena orbiculata]PUB76177.1 MAG: hypothetical protein DBO99_14720 [gamma proteobacterium symbiont of Ctena orbiculata]
MSIPSQKQISENRRLLQNPYAYLDGEGGYDAAPKVVEASAAQIAANRRLLGDQYAFLDDTGGLSGEIPVAASKSAQVPNTKWSAHAKRPGYQGIEQAAKKLQENIWQRRHDLWPDGVPDDPVELLDPAIALNLIEFDFDLEETLGQYSSNGETFEVAGIIDRTDKRVLISRQMPFNTRRFTAAHELAHAVLHEGVRMHRDRPLDGSGQESGARGKIEKEADKFATFFLMPENLVRARFRQFFLSDKFALNEATIFALDPSGSLGLQDGKKTLRQLSRILAKSESFNGRHFRSLADQFHVSVETMAIRLEELGLLEV